MSRLSGTSGLGSTAWRSVEAGGLATADGPRSAIGRRHGRLKRRACAALAACVIVHGAAACDDTPAGGSLARQVLDAVNQLRSSRGLSRLDDDAALQAIACSHSRALAASGSLSHEGFDARFDHSGRERCVENLAAGYRDAASLLRAWQASPPHAHNLAVPGVSRAGVAVSTGQRGATRGGVVVLFACSAALAP